MVFFGVIVGFSFIIGFSGVENIDNFAHIGGLLVGICLGIWFLKSEFEED